MRKKKIVFHSNHSKAFTGFGKNTKNILIHLHKTGKYDIVEFANGLKWGEEKTKKLPWKVFGSLPEDPLLLQQLNNDPQLGRAAGYGANMVDKIIEQEKPDLYIGSEDIWAFKDYTDKEWWNKTNCMIWTTLDSLPILPDAVVKAPQIKNYYVWASFAEKALHELGHKHVKTLRGSIDCSTFFRIEEENRKRLRKLNNIEDDCFVIGFVFRNQLRKSVPNLLEGFKRFLQQEPRCKSKLLLHTHWAEGWDIPRLINEKGIDPNLILTTYFCHNCNNYEVRSFTGQKQPCRKCGGKDTLNTTNTTKGVNENQLNEIYNLMDVYCHPFTSGGQEIPIQEAKLTELITLVTDYSCGSDSCCPSSGGIPLDWSEYREPGTQFIKASTSAGSIANNLKKVYKMKAQKRRALERKSRQYVLDNYDISVIGSQLEDIIDKMPEVSFDFDLSFKPKNSLYSPPNIKNNDEWIIDLYKNILHRDVDKSDQGFRHWMQRLSSDMTREQVLEYFQSVAAKENNENQKIKLDDLFEKNGKKKALMVCSGDLTSLFTATSLLDSFHENYPDTDLYFACHPQFQNIFNGNPNIKKVIPYHQAMEDEFQMIGRSNHEGYVDYYINLNNSILKNVSSKNCYELC
tara:strand:+ start:11041 stop:12924 length:1884 start_codon:yes stop_codon:yes gene_type:complete